MKDQHKCSLRLLTQQENVFGIAHLFQDLLAILYKNLMEMWEKKGIKGLISIKHQHTIKKMKQGIH